MPKTGIVIARWAGLALALASCGSARRVHSPSLQLAPKHTLQALMPLLSSQRALTRTAAASATAPAGAETLEVFVVDVGQGDATVLVGPGAEQDRHVVIIDAGPLSHPDAGMLLKQFLDSQGIQHIDYAVLTHFDADHLGGFVTTQGSTSLLWSKDCSATKFFPRFAVYEHATETFTTRSAREWDRCIRPVARRVRVSKAVGLGDVLELGGGYAAKIIAGDGYVLDREQRVAKVSSENARSTVVLVSGPGGFEMLIPGDATGQPAGAERAEVELAVGEYLAANGIDLEVLRVGHHGSDNTSNPAFIEVAKPELAVISVGDQQPANFKHPRCKTYETLAVKNVRYVLQTEAGRPDCKQPQPTPLVAHGTIRIGVTGATYRVTSMRSDATLDVEPVNLTCTLSECVTTPPAGASSVCCRYCNTGQPCGDTCIATEAVCSKPPGCACAAE